MVTTLRCPTAAVRPVVAAGVRLAIGLVLLAAAAQVEAQQANIHYWHAGTMLPGAIGQLQLQRGGPLPGYFQPVDIVAPAGTEVALADANQFAAAEPAPIKAGLLIGSVYRLRVTNIPQHLGEELFPTIELINRLYAPVGQELRFSIPVELVQEDLELALRGQFVTRVIYLEDPRRAMPAATQPDSPNWFDVTPGRDPLAVADALGRPVAILRMGGRTPDSQEIVSPDFLYGSPPWLRFRTPEAANSAATIVPPAAPPTTPAGPGEKQP